MIEERAAELGIEIPKAPTPGGSYVPANRTGRYIFTAGMTSSQKGQQPYVGAVGREVTVEEAQEAARLCALNCLAAVKAEIGSLDRIARIVKVNGYVHSAPGFDRQHVVMNGASDLLEQLFGERGRHARTSVGVNELPNGIPVEVEMIVEVEE